MARSVQYCGSIFTQSNFVTIIYIFCDFGYWSGRNPKHSRLFRNSFEQWQIEGSADAPTRANEKWKRMLREYEAPALDDDVLAELDEWVTRRQASFPDSDV